MASDCPDDPRIVKRDMPSNNGDVVQILEEIERLSERLSECLESSDWLTAAELLAERGRLLDKLGLAVEEQRRGQATRDDNGDVLPMRLLEEIQHAGERQIADLESRKSHIVQAIELLNSPNILRAYGR
jgi:hypothetical protein